MPRRELHRFVGQIIHLIRKEKGMRQAELALLTGLKQPNLSRIENGLVTPRQTTLDRIARALGVEAAVFFSESKLQEVERKWAASLGPRHTVNMLSRNLVNVPLLDTAMGWPAQLNDAGEPRAPMECVLQLPESGDASTRRFALRICDDSMQGRTRDDFRFGEVAVFADHPQTQSGDFAFVILKDGGFFRQIEFLDNSRLNLMALNPNVPQRILNRIELQGMWRLVRHLRTY